MDTTPPLTSPAMPPPAAPLPPALNIFVCWSGERGQGFAKACQTWLQDKLFKDRVIVTLSADFEKGTVWFDELTGSLGGARLGLICLTPEGIDSPWIHFEAGMLARALAEQPTPAGSSPGVPKLRIFPFLLGVAAGVLGGPLSAYQGTAATDKDDAWRLVEAILSVLPPGSPDEARDVRQRFRQVWDTFQQDLKDIPPVSLQKVLPDFEEWFQRKTFDESMYDCLSQGWLERYNGARDVDARLRSNQKTVREACGRFAADVFDALVSEVDGYAQALSKLVGRSEAPVKPDGRLDFAEPGIAGACERRRKHVKALVALLSPGNPAPLFDEAFQFARGETVEEKRRLINRIIAKIRLDRDTFTAQMQSTMGTSFRNPAKKDLCRVSEWEFDRIVYYAWIEETEQNVPIDVRISSIRLELDKASLTAPNDDLIALEWSLGPLADALTTVVTSEHARELRRTLTEFDRLLKGKDPQKLNQVRLLRDDVDRRLPPSVSPGEATPEPGIATPS
jgi:hypothetical protein